MPEIQLELQNINSNTSTYRKKEIENKQNQTSLKTYATPFSVNPTQLDPKSQEYKALLSLLQQKRTANGDDVILEPNTPYTFEMPGLDIRFRLTLTHKLILRERHGSKDSLCFEVVDTSKPIIGKGGFGKVYHSEGVLSVAKDFTDATYKAKPDLRVIKEMHIPRDERLNRKMTSIQKEVKYCDKAGFFHIKNPAVHNQTGEVVAYVAMRNLGSTDLQKVIQAHLDKTHALSNQQRLDYTIQFLKGLHDLHERGICHGDVKPANAAIDEHGKLSMLDMGFSEDLDTMVDDPHGTPLYLAPEGSRFGRATKHNRQFDIFSAGVSIAELWDITSPTTHYELERENSGSYSRMFDGLFQQTTFSDNTLIDKDIKFLMSRMLAELTLTKNPDERLALPKAIAICEALQTYLASNSLKDYHQFKETARKMLPAYSPLNCNKPEKKQTSFGFPGVFFNIIADESNVLSGSQNNNALNEMMLMQLLMRRLFAAHQDKANAPQENIQNFPILMI